MPRYNAFVKASAVVERTRAQRDRDQSEIDSLNEKIRKILPEKERADLDQQTVKADLDSKSSFYDIAVEQNPRAESTLKLKQDVEKLKKDVAAAKAVSDKYGDEIKQLQQKKDNYEQPLTKAIGDLKKLLDDFDRQITLAVKKKWGISDYIRSIPVIDGFASPTKIEQITLNDLTIDYNFKGVTRFDRCMTCHKGIARRRVKPERVCVDHVEEHTVRLALDGGFWCGMTLYPTTKCTPERAVDILEMVGTERIMVNSAGDWGKSDPLAVPEFILEMKRRGHPEEAIRKVVFDNPLNFWRQCARWQDWTAAPAKKKKETVGSY